MRNILFCLFIATQAIGQKDTTKLEINSLKGDVITDKGTKNVFNRNLTVYKNYTEANKTKILLVNKYIDTTKAIYIKSAVIAMTSIQHLRWGQNIFEDLDIRVVKGQLLISTTINNVDGKFIAKVKDNRLIPEPDKYTRYASEKFIEVYNEYRIPVLQIDLNKKTNSICLGGLFFKKDKGLVYIVSENSIEQYVYPKPYEYMSQTERDVFLNRMLSIARNTLKPLHE